MREETIRRLNTGELMARLVSNVSALADRQIALAKEEAREDVTKVATGGGLLGAGVLLAYTAIPALVTAIILFLAPTLSPAWVALIVAAIFAVIGGIVAFFGYRRVKLQPLEKTRQTLKEDVEWARSQTK
ncbi:MAG: phage holin family protein [Chloroflexota bacterium]